VAGNDDDDERATDRPTDRPTDGTRKHAESTPATCNFELVIRHN
jgi:hypothetical protein